jgi:hypothetical protein
MNDTLKLYLTPDIYAELRVSIKLPKSQAEKAEAIGIGPEEQHNLMDQKLGELLQLLGNTDEV